MTFMFSPKNHPFWTCRCFSTGLVQPTVGQNDTQIKSRRDSHQSCFWCEALLANLRNVQKDGTRFFNLLSGGHWFHRQFRTGALWNDTGLQPHQCQTLRVTRKVAGNAESCRSIWVPWYQKIRGKNTDSTLHNFLDHGNKHFRSPCFGWNLVGWLIVIPKYSFYEKRRYMKLMILPNFAENQVCNLRFRFHRVHATFFSTRSFLKIFQVMISKNNEAGPWGRILIIFGLSLEIQEMDVLFCCCFFL